MSTMVGPPDMPWQSPRRKRSATPPVRVPVPTKEYMQQASRTPRRCSSQRPLLIILDLNGTLIFRKHKRMPPSFARRAGLEHFLDVLAQKYAVMIWSSSRPATVTAVCDRLFPENKSLVALWGRDKFGLTATQYNAKLQVYKELHKVWEDPEIQAAYPSNESTKNAAASNPSDGNSQTHHQNHRPNNPADIPFPMGQRWDQTNTVLIDDSKLKALSEPYSILEIPEFTNDPTVDESALFTKVLDRLDALSHHDDVSKMLRVWNERAAQEKRTILEMNFASSEESSLPEDDEEEGGTSLMPSTTHTARSRDQRRGHSDGQEQTPMDTADPKEIARLKKEAKKARKKAKKAAKLAKQPVAAEVKATAKSEASAGSGQPANSNLDKEKGTSAAPNAKANPRKKNKKGKKGKRVDEQPTTEPATGPRYNFRTRQPVKLEEMEMMEQSTKSEGVHLTAHPGMKGEGDGPSASISHVFPMNLMDSNRRSPTRSASENSLLDRLEEGLGFPRR